MNKIKKDSILKEQKEDYNTPKDFKKQEELIKRDQNV